MDWRGLYGSALDEARGTVVVLGIDLGTTYSTVSRIEWSGDPGTEPKIEVLKLAQRTGAGVKRSALVPSVVAIKPDGTILVGEEAVEYRRSASAPLFPGRDYFENSKNEIGTSRQYPQSRSEDVIDPIGVAAKVLGFLMASVRKDFPDDTFDRVVVTVPASFQLTQREDTIAAAERAGVKVLSNDLLDEPVAAMLTSLGTELPTAGTQHRSVVIDFGGGTCDVALLECSRGSSGLSVEVAGTSRYSRLGGSDIDKAITVQHLLPRLAAANGVSERDWSYPQRSAVLIPALRPVAEELKIKMSTAMHDRKRIGRGWDDVVVRGSRDHSIRLGASELRLSADQITLTAPEFVDLAQGYFDPEVVRPIEGEYYDMQSVFAPLLEVLGRRDWNLDDVDDVLFAGGSSYLEPVVDAVEVFFGVRTRHVVPVESQYKQTEISQGAALQAFGLALTGVPLAKSFSGEALVMAVRASEPVTVIPAGVSLPWPDDRLYATVDAPLRISDARQALKIEVRRGVATTAVRMVSLPDGTRDGDAFTIHASIDENQTVTLEVEFQNGSRSSFRIERPFTYVHNPAKYRDEILIAEGELTTPGLSAGRKLALRRQLASLYLKVGHRDKALASAQIVLREARNESELASGVWLTASAHADNGDLDDAFDVYRKAIAGGAGHLRFAFANMLDQRRRYDEALAVLDEIPGFDDGIRMALRGSVLTGLRRSTEARDCFVGAKDSIGHPRTATPTERSWLAYVARQLGDSKLLDELEELDRSVLSGETGALPELAKEV